MFCRDSSYPSVYMFYFDIPNLVYIVYIGPYRKNVMEHAYVPATTECPRTMLRTGIWYCVEDRVIGYIMMGLLLLHEGF